MITMKLTVTVIISFYLNESGLNKLHHVGSFSLVSKTELLLLILKCLLTNRKLLRLKAPRPTDVFSNEWMKQSPKATTSKKVIAVPETSSISPLRHVCGCGHRAGN